MSAGARLLGGDIGGTKTLLRVVEPGGEISAEDRYDSGVHATLEELVAHFLEGVSGPVDSACLAVAGPVYEGEADVTNVGWKVSERELAARFGFRRTTLINDFFAVALGVPLLAVEDLVTIQLGVCDRSAPMAILGAGTGLGEAFIVPAGDSWNAFATEGGHGDFAPQDEQQGRLLRHLQAEHGHVSWERVVSGIGLVNIFTFLGGTAADGGEVAELCEAGDPLAAEAFRIFVDAYGAEAGNMGLRLLARGGVFLAGGIAAKNLGRFTDGKFLDAFVRKGRFRSLLETMPVHVITNENVGLLGAVEAAKRAAAMG
ncbi:MAG: glucokinase [Thermoanaerobaculia bacterium]